MKITLADGTEVEVAEDHPLAVAARELDRVKALGYDSIEAYQKDYDDKVKKLEKHNEDNDAFINRQKNTIGDLRKELESKGVKKEVEEEEDEVKEETSTEREARFRAENDKIRDALTEDESAHADKEFAKAYKDAAPDKRALLNTEEGKREFLKLIFPEREEVNKETPISLFSKPDAPKLSIGEQVRKALQEDDEGRSRRPVIGKAGGSGYNPDRKKIAEDLKKVKKPIQTGGGVIGAVTQLEQQGD
jgi:hypothetical protein